MRRSLTSSEECIDAGDSTHRACLRKWLRQGLYLISRSVGLFVPRVEKIISKSRAIMSSALKLTLFLMWPNGSRDTALLVSTKWRRGSIVVFNVRFDDVGIPRAHADPSCVSTDTNRGIRRKLSLPCCDTICLLDCLMYDAVKSRWVSLGCGRWSSLAHDLSNSRLLIKRD